MAPKKYKTDARVHIRTFGCQMNKYDSKVMADLLTAAGCTMAESPGEADVILFNTCTVREHAHTRLLGVVNSMKPLKKKNPDLIIGICGCAAQKDGAGLLEKLPHVDIVCGTKRFGDIVNILNEFMRTGRRTAALENGPGEDPSPPADSSDDSVVSFVTVLRGCSNFCSYCVVPFLRGPEASRTPKMILEEIKSMAGRGVREVCLLGQNVLAYGRDLSPGENFTGLLEKINGIPGILRIRFLSSHPRDVEADLIHAIKTLPGVCEHIHLPVQAGSDRILKLMGRGYTREGYLDLIKSIRSEIPGISITTDMIVGFPSETEDDFADTSALLETAGFDDAFLYRYSPREGTQAFMMEDSVPEEIKKERLSKVIELQQEISRRKNAAFAGKTVEVLVEGKSGKSPDMVFGRTRNDKNVLLEGSPALKGSLVKARVIKTGPFTLVAERSSAGKDSQ